MKCVAGCGREISKLDSVTWTSWNGGRICPTCHYALMKEINRGIGIKPPKRTE